MQSRFTCELIVVLFLCFCILSKMILVAMGFHVQKMFSGGIDNLIKRPKGNVTENQ